MNNKSSIRLHNSAAESSVRNGPFLDRWTDGQDEAKKAESVKERVARRKGASDVKVEKLHSDISVDIPKHSVARPKGRISAVNLRSSCSLMGGRPMVFALDRRHRLSVHSNVHGWAYNEYVACQVMGGGKYAGMVLVKRSDLVIERVHEVS